VQTRSMVMRCPGLATRKVLVAASFTLRATEKKHPFRVLAYFSFENLLATFETQAARTGDGRDRLSPLESNEKPVPSIITVLLVHL
jgi:hypothetical protein